jgi:hypothetical protein
MSVPPGLHTCFAAARHGLIWLMLTAVLGVRLARALAERDTRDAASRRSDAGHGGAPGEPTTGGAGGFDGSRP